MHEADDVVLVLAIHREARELVLFDHAQVFLERVFEAQAHHVGARSHDRLDVFIGDIEDVVHEFVLLGIDQAVFGAFVDKQTDFLFGIDVVLVGGIVAHQTHHAIGDRIEQPHDRIGEAIEPHQGTGREQRVFLGAENSERFGNELAHHDMQRRDQAEADCHRHGEVDAFGYAEHFEQRVEQGRHGGLAQPAKSERSKRDAELAGRKIGVDVVCDQLGVFGARASLFDEHVDLGLSYADQRELGHDEKRVHQKEENDKKQT